MKKILFLCTGNSCRSQMAEAWARKMMPPGWEAYSAGIEKHGLNPHMVEVMNEAGVEMSAHYSKTIDELPPNTHWDVVITVCDHAAQKCPYIKAMNTKHMPFDDPPAMARALPAEERLMVYRRVRDEIRNAINELSGKTQNGTYP